ncbi:unnamed protein product [Durusdinium trenchii]|uniref:PH domain-containing protein n=1 Tax=Durusdinium trenchii TaxID=1381693 RepID=A0ABP0RD51_9DINO
MANLTLLRMHEVHSSREIEAPICGDVTYKLGGQFWPSRCYAELRGDLLLITRRHKQQAAIQLSGATVELQSQLSIRIEAPGSPVLVMRLDNGGETVRWMTALQDATQKDQSFRDLLNDVPLLSPRSSPRSESTPQSPTMEELEALRARLSQQESSSKEMEEGMKAACTRADAAAQAFHDSQDRAKCLEKALLEEQAKRKQVELMVEELQGQLASEVSCGKAREPDVKQIDQLQRRLACAEQRLSGAELVRKAAEERREGAEQRLAETEELLEQAVKKLAVSGQSSDDEATRRLRGVEAELKALKLIKAQADADGSELKKDLEEAKAKITTLQQTANQSEAAKVALEAQVETLQTRVADQEARLMDQDELQRALAEQQEAKDTLEKLERLSKQESEEVQKLKASLESSEAETKVAKARIQEMEKHVLAAQGAEKLAARASEDEKTIAKLQAENAAAKARTEEMEKRMLASEGGAEKLSNRASQDAKTIAELQERVASLEKELGNAKEDAIWKTELARQESDQGAADLKCQVITLEGQVSELKRRLSAADQRLSAEQSRRSAAEDRTKQTEERLADLQEDGSTTHLQGKLEAAMVKANREAQARTVAQRQLVAALKAATAANAKIKAAERASLVG